MVSLVDYLNLIDSRQGVYRVTGAGGGECVAVANTLSVTNGEQVLG